MNQNKGIGAYKDRPGYFMGGMIGGAILGALVNKIQGKDWKKGALWGGITGGLGSHFLGGTGMAGSTLKATGSAPAWIGKMNPGIMQSLATMGTQNPHIAGAVLGGGAAWMSSDKEKEEREYWENMARHEAERRRKMLEMYGGTYTDPWQGWNTGGMINARPGYYNGGSATLDYTDPDLYTPTGEGGGPSSNPIQQIPLGPEPSFTDEFDELDLAELSDEERGELQSLMTIRLMTPKDDPKYEQIEIRIQELLGRMGQETAMSQPHPDEGSYDMFFDEFGRYPKDIEELQIFMDGLDLDVPAAAQGGYIGRPKMFLGGLAALLGGAGLLSKVLGRRKKSKFDAELPVKKPILDKIKIGPHPWMPGDIIDEDDKDDIIENLPIPHPQLPVHGLLGAAQGGRVGMYGGGGMEDMDLTRGGASFGAGTGTSDEIPAMLSNGEFVVTADAVSNLGGGDRMLGAKRMYRMMNQLDPQSQTPAEMNTTGIA